MVHIVIAAHCISTQCGNKTHCGFPLRLCISHVLISFPLIGFNQRHHVVNQVIHIEIDGEVIEDNQNKRLHSIIRDQVIHHEGHGALIDPRGLGLNACAMAQIHHLVGFFTRCLVAVRRIDRNGRIVLQLALVANCLIGVIRHRADLLIVAGKLERVVNTLLVRIERNANLAVTLLAKLLLNGAIVRVSLHNASE